METKIGWFPDAERALYVLLPVLGMRFLPYWTAEAAPAYRCAGPPGGDCRSYG